MAQSFDFVVIGAGSGGLTAATFAAQLGVKVALIEKDRIGGDCTWTGCVPSKALLKVAKVAHDTRTAGDYGIQAGPPKIDMIAVRRYLRQAIAAVYQYETPEKLAEEGINIFKGSATFLDPHTIQIGDDRIQAKKSLITTGARPFIPPALNLENTPYLTYEKLFDNQVLPDRLIVLGAGPVGVEMAQAYRRLGAQVTVIDLAILPLHDREASRVVQKVLGQEGVRFVKGLATAVRHDGKEFFVDVNHQQVHGDMLLVATGRKPNVHGLKLEQAGVVYSDKGIQVNHSLRTSIKHIYAAGDVIGGQQFTHLAAWQGFQAARNALLPGRENSSKKPVPLTIFTDPEVAHVGLTEAAAREIHGSTMRVAHQTLHKSDRAVCENDLEGFIKIIHKPDGTILGATIVSDRAGETITEFVLAIEYKLKLEDLASAIHVYPSYTMDAMRLATDVTMGKFVSGLSGSVVRQLTKFAWG